MTQPVRPRTAKTLEIAFSLAFRYGSAATFQRQSKRHEYETTGRREGG
jgi:hypothetical protein